jgi:hypothetical protein
MAEANAKKIAETAVRILNDEMTVPNTNDIDDDRDTGIAAALEELHDAGFGIPGSDDADVLDAAARLVTYVPARWEYKIKK